jgi:hypothetical protein
MLEPHKQVHQKAVSWVDHAVHTVELIGGGGLTKSQILLQSPILVAHIASYEDWAHLVPTL